VGHLSISKITLNPTVYHTLSLLSSPAAPSRRHVATLAHLMPLSLAVALCAGVTDMLVSTLPPDAVDPGTGTRIPAAGTYLEVPEILSPVLRLPAAATLIDLTPPSQRSGIQLWLEGGTYAPSRCRPPPTCTY
jgi:hypothetical protein